MRLIYAKRPRTEAAASRVSEVRSLSVRRRAGLTEATGSRQPAWHFFTKLVFAAPERGLPSIATAASSQHFFMKLAFAAPAKGLPSFPTALVVHAEPA
jgi:hypothetical protein